MEIEILELIEGAKKARGLTVIIDVFRAFSLECYLFARGCKEIYPVGDAAEAFAMKDRMPGSLLIGERGGKKMEGADFGNSPFQCEAGDVKNKTIIHTTSAGTQGIVNASGATEILTGSLVNARAIAEYIRRKDPEHVSLVAMGLAGKSRTPEDILCAEYIRSLLTGNFFDVQARADALKTRGAEEFFVPETQEIFPREDFYMCTQCDRFPFVIRVSRKGDRWVAQKEEVI